MKLGIFDPYLDTLGGGEKYILTAAEYLSADHNVIIFWDPKDAENIREKTKKKFNIDLKKVNFSPSIFAPNTPFLQRLKISRLFDAILYLSDGSIPLVGCNLYVHFQFPVEWVSSSDIKTKIKKFRIKKVFCNSVFTKNFIDKKFGIDSLILYPPADMIIERNVKKNNVILHVGRFGTTVEGKNYKKQDVMIEVFKSMVKKGLRRWMFKIVISVLPQDEEKIKVLKELAKDYPIEFIQNPSNMELARLYAQSKIYWHATGFGEDISLHPERAEHFGIATVEAMSAGSVPVVINAGGQPEIVDNNLNGFLWNTMEELEDKTSFLIKNESIWEKFSKNSQEKAQFFTKKRFCSELHKIVV